MEIKDFIEIKDCISVINYKKNLLGELYEKAREKKDNNIEYVGFNDKDGLKVQYKVIT